MATQEPCRGPAMQAAFGRAQDVTSEPGQSEQLLDLADGEHGVWRCHGAWECTARCPQQVDPAESIMQQRRDLLRRRLRRRGR